MLREGSKTRDGAIRSGVDRGGLANAQTAAYIPSRSVTLYSLALGLRFFSSLSVSSLINPHPVGDERIPSGGAGGTGSPFLDHPYQHRYQQSGSAGVTRSDTGVGKIILVSQRVRAISGTERDGLKPP